MTYMPSKPTPPSVVRAIHIAGQFPQATCLQTYALGLITRFNLTEEKAKAEAQKRCGTLCPATQKLMPERSPL